MTYFIIGLFLLMCFYTFMRWYVTAQPKDIIRVVKWAAAGLFFLLLIWLIFSGKGALLLAALPALFIWLGRARTFINIARMANRMFRGGQPQGGPSPHSSHTSQVETRVLRMSLNTDTGDMDGEVLDGPHLGRWLSELSIEQLKDVWAYCQTCDEEALRVINVYLERHHGEDWNEDTASSQAFNDAMTVEEAYAILGLDEEASSDDVKAAYHRLISQVHPDKGGSDYLAAKINQAKDILLNE